MLVLILGVGLFLSLGLKLMPILRLGEGFRLMWKGRTGGDAEKEGDIPPFQALMTALSATIGTGNIAGVATAVFLGGPGALFWMWLTALVGMATKYSEAVLAVNFREVDERGNYVGGPMYYIRNGAAQKGAWMGGVPGMAEASGVKVMGSEFFVECQNHLLEIAGSAGLVVGGEPAALFDGKREAAYRSATTFTFGGGVNEVQRDIIAMAGLGMPRARPRA